MEKLKSKIEQAKTAYVDIKNQRDASVYDENVLPDIPPFPTYTISSEIADIFKEVKNSTIKELNVYNPTGEVYDVKKEGNHAVSHATHSYVESFKTNIEMYSLFDFSESSLTQYNIEIEMSAAEINLYKVVSAELQFATEFMANLGYSIATLNKIKKAVESIGQKRISDALIILKTSKKGDPNNRSLAFIISQVQYFRVQNGAAEVLPDARAEGKKSCLYSDKCDEQQLRQYRYLYVLQECNFDPKRAVELMREFYLLNPESMTEGNGIAAHEGVHLKSWILLSMLDSNLLTSFEIESLFSITMTAPSGVCFYLNVMRPQLLKRLENENDVSIQLLMKLEKMLHISYSSYNEIISILQQNFDEEGNLTPASQYLWTIESRYTSLLLKAAKIPAFDEIYLYTSLDAKRYSSEAYPNRAMAAMGLPNVNYWQVWSIAITAAEGKGSTRTLPVRRMATHSELFRKFDGLLEELIALEHEIIPAEKWEIIEKYMPNYEYNIFPHVAAGADAFKVPSNPYYLNFYRLWVKEQPKGPLPSEIFKTYAEKGHFIDAEEVIAAFEGVVRVITDEVHGLKTRAKEALKACLKDDESHSSEKAKDLLREGHFNDYWWVYVIVLPLAALSFYVMSGSGDGGIVTLLVIILFAGGLGYGMYSLSKSGKNKQDHEEDDDHDTSP